MTRRDEVLRKAAHGLKGSSGNLGAKVLMRYCAELEELAVRGDLEAARVLSAQGRTGISTGLRCFAGAEKSVRILPIA